VNAGSRAPDGLDHGMIEAIAQAAHSQYLSTTPPQSISAAANHPWKELADGYQDGNRDFARRALQHVVDSGRRLVPDATVRPDAGVEPVFSEEEVAVRAPIEHEWWMRDKRATGWTYGATRNDEDLLHPDLVPWESLDEGARDKDRRLMRGLGTILAAAGLRAERVPPGRR